MISAVLIRVNYSIEADTPICVGVTGRQMPGNPGDHSRHAAVPYRIRPDLDFQIHTVGTRQLMN